MLHHRDLEEPRLEHTTSGVYYRTYILVVKREIPKTSEVVKTSEVWMDDVLRAQACAAS
jgi:hypothetical protein